MTIISSIIFLILGFTLLIKGADMLVDGGSAIAKKFNIPNIVIGLTIVSFGTSTPELLVSIKSALAGSTDLAMGNVIGSCISNILLILGISAVIYPIKISKDSVWKEIPFTFILVLLMLMFGLFNMITAGTLGSINLFSLDQVGVLGRSLGLVLILLFSGFMFYTYNIAKKGQKQKQKEIIQDKETKPRKMIVSIVMVLIGLAGLAFGSDMAVNNATNIAQVFGMTEGLIGLTVVALGTSLPELAASAVAAYKKNSDIAIGNVMGSNLFNILLVLGVTFLIVPVAISGVNVADMLMLLGAVGGLFGLTFLFKKNRIGRVEGFMMISAYFVYTAFLIWRDLSM